MAFLLVGLVAVLMKYMEFGPVAAWPWYVVLSPFALAVLWWWWADASGYTKRVEIEKMETRKQARLEKQRAALGMLSAKRNVKK